MKTFETFETTINNNAFLLFDFLFFDYNSLCINHQSRTIFKSLSNKIMLHLKYFSSNEDAIYKVTLYDYTTGKRIKEWQLMDAKSDDFVDVVDVIPEHEYTFGYMDNSHLEGLGYVSNKVYTTFSIDSNK